MPPPLFAPPLPFLLRSVFLPLSVLLLACLAAPVARLFLCLPRICCALLFLYLVGSVADAATAATTATCPRLRRAPVLAPVLARSGWLATGFDLIKKHAGYTTAALLTAIGLLGVVQGFWTEHSERAILPTALSLQDVASQDKDLLGRWKPERSDTYARAFGGRVARLQAQFAQLEKQIATKSSMRGPR